MKRIISIMSVCCLAMALNTSCKNDDNENDSKSGTGNVETNVLSPEEQKTKLEDVGKELLSKFNPDEQKAIISLIDELVYQFDEYEWNYDNIEYKYQDDYKFLQSVTSYCQGFAQGSFSVQPEIYSFPKLKGIWVADETTRSWHFTENTANSVVLRYKTKSGIRCEAILSGEGEAVTAKGEYEGQPIEIVLPQKITFSLKEGSIEHSKMNINFDIKEHDYFNYDLKMNLANLSWYSITRISKNSAITDFGLKYGNETLITSKVEANDYDIINDFDFEDVEEWEDYDEIPTGIFSGYVDILGKIQVRGYCDNAKDMTSRLDDLDEKYNGYYNQNNSRDSKEYNQQYANIWNNYMKCDLFYGSDKIQAQLKWDVTSYNDSYWDYDTRSYKDYIAYENEPVIYFPQDGSSYAFEDYFEEHSFNILIDMTEDLINRYIKLAKYNKIDFVYF